MVGTWLFLDETLVKRKGSSESEDADPNSFNMLRDSGIEMSQPGTTPGVLLGDEKDESDLGVHQFETDEELATEDELSSYDVSPDTELLRNTQNQSFKRYCKLSRHNVLRLQRLIIIRRVMDCAGGLVACVVCLWTYEYSKCKLSNFRGRGSGRSVLKKLKLVLDRRVFLPISLYGIIAFLAIVSNEVSIRQL